MFHQTFGMSCSCVLGMDDPYTVLFRCTSVIDGGGGFLVDTSVNSPTAQLDACAMGMFFQAFYSVISARSLTSFVNALQRSRPGILVAWTVSEHLT